MTIFYIMIAYIIGIIWGLYIKNIALLFCVLGINISLCVLVKRKTKLLSDKIKIFSKIDYKKVIFLILIIIISTEYINILEKRFLNIYECINSTQDINQEIEGIIVSNISKENKNIEKCTIKVNGYKYILYLKNSKNKLNYGDKIKLEGSYENARRESNYKGFNYQKYLKTKKIYGIINSNKIIKVEKQKYSYCLILLNKIQNRIIENIRQIFKDNNYSSLLTGILIGQKDEIDEDVVDTFQNSNLSHLLAVSGAHVSYIILGITIVLSKFKVGKRNSKIFSICILTFFIFLIGGTSSCTRACIMSIYMILGKIIYRKPNIIASISVSILVLLIINPYNILDIGFKLSYGGTIGIILFNKILNDKFKIKKNKCIKYKKINKIIEYIKQMIIVSLSANIIIFPIIMYYYNTVSLTFLLSNVLASPILGLIIIFGFINLIISFISIKISSIISIPLKFFLEILMLISKTVSNLPFSKIYVKTPYIILIIIYYLVIMYVFFYIKKKKNLKINIIKSKNKVELKAKIKAKIKEIKKKIIIIIIILTLFIIILISIIIGISSNFKIYFIDVGQGDSTLIITPNHKSILIDGGGRSDLSYDIGKKVLIPYLLDRRITTLDYVIISHFDTDHVGGILTVLKELKVKNIIIGKQFENNSNLKDFIQIVKERKINVIVVKEGMKIEIEKNIFVDVLWPKDNSIIKDNLMNNNALVVKLNYTLNNKKKFSVLFTGDIEEEAEKELINKYKEEGKLEANILKVGHHGSKTSSCMEFLELVNARIALIGVGRNNKFGHPNNEVIERLKTMDCKIYRTDVNGEISLYINKHGKIKILSYYK